jgi:hypothetical protein
MQFLLDADGEVSGLSDGAIGVEFKRVKPH